MLAAKSTIDVSMTGLTPYLSIKPPATGSEIAEHRAQSARPDEMEPRSQPNSAYSGLMKTPNENTLIDPLTTMSAKNDPMEIHHGDIDCLVLSEEIISQTFDQQE